MKPLRYNTLYTKYVALLEEHSLSLKGDVELLKENARLRNSLEEANSLIRRYKSKYGKLEGGKVDVKNNNKKW